MDTCLKNIHLIIGCFAAILTTALFTPSYKKLLKHEIPQNFFGYVFLVFFGSINVAYLWVVSQRLHHCISKFDNSVFALIILIICLLNLKKRIKILNKIVTFK